MTFSSKSGGKERKEMKWKRLSKSVSKRKKKLLIARIILNSLKCTFLTRKILKSTKKLVLNDDQHKLCMQTPRNVCYHNYIGSK